MTSMIYDLAGDISKAMVGKVEGEIRVLLDECWPAGWTVEDVKRRCRIEVRGNVETYFVDDEPVLELHPIEFEQVPTDTGWTMRATRNFRRFPQRRSVTQETK